MAAMFNEGFCGPSTMLRASSETLIQSSQQPRDTDTILVTALEMTMKRLNDLPKGLQLGSDRSRIPTWREISARGFLGWLQRRIDLGSFSNY